jgi:hypothetical protein
MEKATLKTRRSWESNIKMNSKKTDRERVLDSSRSVRYR